MRSDNEFQKQLDVLAREIVPAGRLQVEQLIASVINAGGTSERALIEMVHNRSLSHALRANVCWLIPRLKISAAGDILKALMSDSSEQVREEAAMGLGFVSDSDAVEVLLHAVDQESSKSVRSAALHSLGMQGSPQSVTSLTVVLKNAEEDAEIRADAAEALAHIKDRRSVDVLIKSLKDNSPLVRYSAVYALGEQGDRKALAPLREIAQSDSGITPWGSVKSGALAAIEAIEGRDS